MKKTKKVRFTKITGAGNDFLVIDLRDNKNQVPVAKRKALVIAACNRHYGVGADGLIFLEAPKDKKNNFKWDFYNKDGSHAEMCLNASRCVVRYELQNTKTVKFESIVGVVSGEEQGRDIEVNLQVKQQRIKLLSLKSKNIEFEGYAVNSGVPHFVVHKKIKITEELKEHSSHLRFNDVFGKPGSNVTYWYEKGATNFQAVTFERGVEDFTLACGTGAVAVAMVLDFIYQKNPVNIQMPGGKIKVALGSTIKNKSRQAKILGPAEIICEGELCLKV